MTRILLSTPFQLLIALVVTSISMYADIGHDSWVWFQRSGSVLALVGAILGYRSIVRLGKAGVGGAPIIFAVGKVVSVDNSGPLQKIKMSYDEETEDRFTQHDLDKAAGYIGAWIVIIGTLIWGYGDLLGLLF